MIRYPVLTSERMQMDHAGIVDFSHCGCGCGGIRATMGVEDRRELFNDYPEGPHSSDTVFLGSVIDELVVWEEKEEGGRE